MFGTLFNIIVNTGNIISKIGAVKTVFDTIFMSETKIESHSILTEEIKRVQKMIDDLDSIKEFEYHGIYKDNFQSIECDLFEEEDYDYEWEGIKFIIVSDDPEANILLNYLRDKAKIQMVTKPITTNSHEIYYKNILVIKEKNA